MDTLPYTIRSGDTLSGIAKRNHSTVDQLQTINGIEHVNQIRAGQVIQVPDNDPSSKDPALQYVFIDKLLQPIQGIFYQFKLPNGSTTNGKTDENGLTQLLQGLNPGTSVEMWVQRQIGSMKKIHQTIVEDTRKVVTAYSPSIKTTVDTKKHDGPAGTGTKTGRDKEGHPILVIDKKDVELDFLDTYDGRQISDSDIKEAANDLGCHPGLIYAIAKQESSKSSFININGRTLPTILYERHCFRNYTRPHSEKTKSGKNKNHSPSPYEKTNPDICGPAYKRAKKFKDHLVNRKTGEEISEDDAYGPTGLFQYRRLLRAYALNQEAALKSCSWGKFQIMGFNYTSAGFSDVKSFTRAMSRNDSEHIKAFLKFAKSNPTLLSGLRQKKFEDIAKGHNGDDWKSTNPEYAENIEKYYGEYIKKDHDGSN